MIELLKKPVNRKYAFNRGFYPWITYLDMLDFMAEKTDKNGLRYITASVTIYASSTSPFQSTLPVRGATTWWG